MELKKNIKDYCIITLGCFLLAFAIQKFFLPHNLVIGGFSGLGIIIVRYADSLFNIKVSMSTINLILNLPLFIVTFYLLSFKMVFRSFYSTMMVSLALKVLIFIPEVPTDLFLASIFGGVVAGLGLGLVISRFSTTGGTDLVAIIINHYNKHFNVAKLMFGLDCCIILLGLFAFGLEKCMYAIIAIYICTKVIDNVLEGVNFVKVVYIITDCHEEITKALLVELDAGITGLKSIGMYTEKEKITLMTAVSAKEVPTLKEITKRYDSNAFIIITEAREIFGEGFRNLAS